MKYLLPFGFAACASAATAFDLTEDQAAFVDSNMRGIFYHELGHAIIHLQGVPIFGQEEDAADVLSAFLIDGLYEGEEAQSIAFDAALGFITTPDDSEDAEVDYWGVHGPDEQRFYNHVCIFYGADPENRQDFAEDLGLPEERAESCPDEYLQAADAWGPVLDDMVNTQGAKARFLPGEGPIAEFLNPIIAQEVDTLNADFSFSSELTVQVDSCDTPNAFYDGEEQTITMCTEFVPYLANGLKNFE